MISKKPYFQYTYLLILFLIYLLESDFLYQRKLKVNQTKLVSIQNSFQRIYLSR